MDTLAYFHLAASYEEPMEPSTCRSPLNGINWTKLSSSGWVLFLSLGMIVGILSISDSAMALKQGDQGQSVIALQQKLKHLGYFHGKVTGYYGPVTTQAVRDYQCDQGLPVLGVAGPKTHKALGLVYGTVASSSDCNCYQPVSHAKPASGAGHKTQSLSHGSRGSDVVHIQDLLKSMGYFHGRSTGYYGSVTVAAVKAFQRQHGLTVDGIVGPKTHSAINYAFHD